MFYDASSADSSVLMLRIRWRVFVFFFLLAKLGRGVPEDLPDASFPSLFDVFVVLVFLSCPPFSF